MRPPDQGPCTTPGPRVSDLQPARSPARRAGKPLPGARRRAHSLPAPGAIGSPSCGFFPWSDSLVVGSPREGHARGHGSSRSVQRAPFRAQGTRPANRCRARRAGSPRRWFVFRAGVDTRGARHGRGSAFREPTVVGACSCPPGRAASTRPPRGTRRSSSSWRTDASLLRRRREAMRRPTRPSSGPHAPSIGMCGRGSNGPPASGRCSSRSTCGGPRHASSGCSGPSGVAWALFAPGHRRWLAPALERRRDRRRRRHDAREVLRGRCLGARAVSRRAHRARRVGRDLLRGRGGRAGDLAVPRRRPRAPPFRARVARVRARPLPRRGRAHLPVLTGNVWTTWGDGAARDGLPALPDLVRGHDALAHVPEHTRAARRGGATHAHVREPSARARGNGLAERHDPDPGLPRELRRRDPPDARRRARGGAPLPRADGCALQRARLRGRAALLRGQRPRGRARGGAPHGARARSARARQSYWRAWPTTRRSTCRFVARP